MLEELARALLRRRVLVLLVTVGGGTVDQAKAASGGLELTRRLAAEPGRA